MRLVVHQNRERMDLMAPLEVAMVQTIHFLLMHCLVLHSTLVLVVQMNHYTVATMVMKVRGLA